MIIHADALILLDYEPTTDVLYVKWPNLVDVPVVVIENSFKKLADTIKHYNITKLLIDSKGTTTRISDEDYKPLAMKLFSSFADSNLKKIARVISDERERELKAKRFKREFSTIMPHNYESKEFPDRNSAEDWLTSEE